MQDVADRVADRIQLTSDGHRAYLEAVEGAFGADIDYAMLVKIYGASSESAKGRYSPAECIGAQKDRIEGKPDMRTCQHVLQRALQSHDADAQSPLYSPDERVLQEIREPRAHGRDLCRLVQLDPHPQDAARYAGDGRRPVRKPLWTGREIVEAMDADAPAKKRGPYKKASAEISN